MSAAVARLNCMGKSAVGPMLSVLYLLWVYRRWCNVDHQLRVYVVM